MRNNGRPDSGNGVRSGQRRRKRLVDWLRTLLSPGGHLLAFRRIAAVVLALFAGMLALQPRPGPAATDTTALTVTHDLPPGHVLGPDDLAVRRVPEHLVPHGALREVASAAGHVLGGAARRGEVITNTRLVGAELTGLTTGREDYATVPVRLAEPGIAELVHPGRRVDIVTASADAAAATVLAEQAPVIAVRPARERNEPEPLLLVGLPRQQAAEVAAASVIHSLTVTLR